MFFLYLATELITYIKFFFLVIGILPVVYLIYIWSGLPLSVAVHFGLDGTPDRYGSKSEFLTVQLILTCTAIFIYLLLKFLPSIDLKKYVKYGEATFQKMALGLVVFFSALVIAITFATVNHSFKIDKLVFPLVGLLVAFIGNVMHRIKPNYFAGIRTPWTLEDDDTWRATHRLAGKLWFVGGIALTVAVLLMPALPGIIVFMSVTAILVLIPVVYSYVYYRKHHLSKNSDTQ